MVVKILQAVAVASLVLHLPVIASAAEPTPQQIAFYRGQVKPILVTHCIKCHGGEKTKGQLKLTSRKSFLAGGESGEVFDAATPGESVLLSAINYNDLEMPPGGKLPQAKIDVLTRWIKMGAPYVPGETDPVPGKKVITDEDRNWWSYRKLVRPVVPKVKNPSWVRNPIDAFVLARLESSGLKPAPPADKVALLRRVYYDLTGLPPTPKEVDAFLADGSPQAYEKVIDRLLKSPHYGEKWGRHWLDLVRYAETNGYERDGNKPFAWKYRDWVIQSFNKDKPYDRFILEQLAGDELPDADNESLAATAYYRLGIWDDEPVDRLQAYYDGLDDVVRTTGEVFMGMTVGCGRCHAHKIDPLLHADYYRLLAFFNNIARRGGRAYPINTVAPVATPAQHQTHQAMQRQLADQLKTLQDKIAAFERRIVATFSNPEKEDAKDAKTRQVLIAQKRDKVLSPEQLKDYLATAKELEQLKKKRLPPLPQTLVVKEDGRDMQAMHVFLRGNAHVHGEKVVPGFPTVLGFDDPKISSPREGLPSTGHRLVLARWLTNRDNPLTSRVMANRLWQFHFGRGIAATTSDLGKAGTPPTHPLLLDWLAVELMDRRWSLKAMHKLIATSNAYRMSSAPNAAALKKDPANQLFWRFDIRRLTAEEIRDSVLAVNGTLNPKMFGPSIYPPLPPTVLATASRPSAAWGRSSPEEAARRSVYIKVKRSLHHPMMRNFDAADTDTSCAVRFTTTVPTQALEMLNSRFINQQAELFATQLEKEAPKSLADKIRRAVRLTTGRTPDEKEIAADVAFIESLQKEEKLDARKALVNYCLVMLNQNEFVYLK